MRTQNAQSISEFKELIFKFLFLKELAVIAAGHLNFVLPDVL